MSVRSIIVIVLIARAASPASAQDAGKKKDSAELLFQEGQQLIKDGKIADACPKFEQSQRLDPAIGTLLNLAQCYELLGRVASAWSSYVDAESMARDKKDKRQKGAHARAAELAPLVPKLLVTVKDAPPGLALTLGGRPFDVALVGATVPEDPGQVELVATAEGFLPFTRTITMTVGQPTTVDVVLEPVKVVQQDDPETVSPPPPEQDVDVIRDEPRRVSRGRGRRIAGITLGGVGLAAIGGGAVLAVLAHGRYGAQFEGDTPHCDRVTAGCDQAGLAATKKAARDANLAGVIAGAGVLAAAVGVYLFVSAPHDTYLYPTASDGAVGLAFGGSL